jgi:hypothetical protein
VSNPTLEELTQRLAVNVAKLENATTKIAANRAALMLKSTMAKLDMVQHHHVPAMEQQTSGDVYESSLSESDVTDLWGFLEEPEDVQSYVEMKLGDRLVGDVTTDIIADEYYVEFRTRAGAVFGSGDTWADAVVRALSAYEEIKKRAKVSIREIPQKVAYEFIAQVHRHHDPPSGDKFRLGAFSMVNSQETLVGVVVVGHPQARKLQEKEPKTGEVTRMATLAGATSLNSQLYSAAWRETLKRGQYDKLITYIGLDEPGTSLKASGWWIDKAEVEGGSWGRPSRGRVDHHPTENKVRWAISKAGKPQTAAG